MEYNALIIEDDIDIAHILSLTLTKMKIKTTIVYSGNEALEYLKTLNYDLILLDLMLPHIEGEELLTYIKKHLMSRIIVVSAKTEVEEKVRLLNKGADDYLTKPFYLDELKARIQALLKRTGKLEDSNGLTYGNIRLNLSNKSTLVDDQPVDLIGKEFDLVVYLMQNQNVILPKSQIFDRIWGFDSDTTISVVEVYVSKIRKKLKGTSFAKNLQTLRSVGYILKDAE